MVVQKKKKLNRPKGVVPNEIIIRATPGIRLEDINVGDMVSYTHPTCGSRKMGKVTLIKNENNIHTIDWVKDILILKLINIREIWKERGGEWVRLPLHNESS
ncbi:MAG: hypothetical protein KAS66_08355 [Candidatus Omnitrophica bacterium]|nr:hypothetical protein [Candidatus Omnitrophota bacterium]